MGMAQGPVPDVGFLREELLVHAFDTDPLESETHGFPQVHMIFALLVAASESKVSHLHDNSCENTRRFRWQQLLTTAVSSTLMLLPSPTKALRAAKSMCTIRYGRNRTM
jgi:hypothetical protein